MPALAAAAARCAVGGLLCTARRCTAPPCASRGGRAAREGAASRAICSACNGARARGWAHWSIGTWSAAARASGRTRVWAVRSGRAREPRAPGRSTHTQAPFQTAQPPHRAAFVTRRACGAGPALRRNEVVDGSHDRPSQRGATITWPSGAATPPGSGAGTALSRRHDLYDNPRGRPQAVNQAISRNNLAGRELRKNPRKGSSFFGPLRKASMVGFISNLAPLLNYLRRRSPGPPFPPDHRQTGERGL